MLMPEPGQAFTYQVDEGSPAELWVTWRYAYWRSWLTDAVSLSVNWGDGSPRL